MKHMKRTLCIILSVLMLATMTPLVPQTYAAGGDDTNVNIPITLGAATETRGEAMARTLEYTQPDYNDIPDWNHPSSTGELEELLMSKKASDKYISLTKDLYARWKHAAMETIVITEDKVLDLNGHTIEYAIDSNVRFWSKGYTEQPPKARDDIGHYMNTAYEIEDGATVYVIDSSAKNSYSGKDSQGRIYMHGYMVNPYTNDINYYAHYEIFKVTNGNLLIYGGNFQAGRSKAQFKSKFSWSKLKNVIGQAVELGVSVANFATGIDAAVAAKNDVVDAFKKIDDDIENYSTKVSRTEKKDPTTNDPDGKKDLQTIGTKQDEIDNPKPDSHGNIPEPAENNSSNGKQEANASGSAKSDKNTKIAEANKKIVDASTGQNGSGQNAITSIVNKAFSFCEGIADMVGVDQNSRIIQTHFGTCVRVGANGTFVSYGGNYIGFGSSPNTKNAVVEVVRNKTLNPQTGKYNGGLAYIYGGNFTAKCGANVFNIVEAASNYTMEQVRKEDDGSTSYETVTINDSETMGLKEIKYESNGSPVDTVNIQVRGGTFDTQYEAKCVGLKYNSSEHFTRFIGTPGAVNLGVTSFNEDFVKDGRIQISDNYGNGSLVLMDEKSGDSGNIYHYRLFCSDTELRFKQGLRVYPNTAKTNTTNSFALKTQLNGGDTSEVEKVFATDEENIRGAYSTTEKLFYFPIDDERTPGYTITPTFKDLDPDAENMSSSPSWYYQDPVDTSGDVIEPLRIKDMVISGTLKSSAISNYQQVDPAKITNSFNSTLNTITSTFGGKTYVDAHTMNNNWEDLPKVFEENYDVVPQEFNYVSNMKWFEFKIYKVDPLTRLNIGKSGKLGDDEPLATAVYGDQARKGLKTLIRLTDLETQLQKQDPDFKFRQGEMYRITLNVEECLNYNYCGYDQYNTNTYNSNTNEYAFTTNLSTAKATSSILFLCFGSEEKKVTENYNQAVTDYTPLQWDGDFKAGQKAKINFVNAKTGNVDWKTNMIYDIYYQWWTVKDNGQKDQLIAGTTNVWDIRDAYEQAKAQNLNREDTQALLNTGKQDHTYSYWLRGTDDGYLYANTLAPDDPLLKEKDKNGKQVVYGDGEFDKLPVIKYTSNGQIQSGTNLWPLNRDAAARLIHAYSLQWVDPEDLKDQAGYDLSNQNNNQNYGSSDTCYIPKSLAGKKIMVEAIAVNVNWTDYYDGVQTFYSHTYQIPERTFDQPLGGRIGVKYGSKGDYTSIFNNATLSLEDVSGLESDEYITNVQFSVGPEGKYYKYKDFTGLKKGDKLPTCQFPKDFFKEKELEAGQGLASPQPKNYTIRVKYQTNLENYPKRYFDYSVTYAPFEVEAEGVKAKKESYTFDIEDLKSGAVKSGDIDLFTVYPLNYTIGLYYDTAKSTDKNVAYIDADGKLAFGGSAGDATLTYAGPDGKKATIKVKVIDYVDDVEINDIDPPEIGKTFKTGVTIPDGVDYHIEDVFWTNGKGEKLNASATAVNYKSYTINIVIGKNDPTLVFKEQEPWCYDNYHPFTLYANTVDGGIHMVSNNYANGQLEYVQDPATGEYKVGDTCTYTYTYYTAIGAADDTIDRINMDFPAEVTEGDSIDAWMNEFSVITNGDDTQFTFKKGFSFTSFAEQTFKAYGYHIDFEDPTDTLKSFMRGIIDGPKVEIDVDPDGQNEGLVGFADESKINVYVNGEIDPNTEILAESHIGIFNVPGALRILDGKAIPALPKYRILDFNLVKGQKIYLDDLMVTDGYIRLEVDEPKMDGLTDYLEYNGEENSLYAKAASSENLLIPLYINVDANGDGIVDMRVNENRRIPIYSSNSAAPQLDNGYPIDIQVKALNPDGSVAYDELVEGIRFNDKAMLDIPEVDGAFFTEIVRDGDPDFKVTYSSWTGRIFADLTDGDEITVKTVDVDDIVVKTSTTEIYPDFPEAGEISVSLDGDHWTTSKIAFTGLDPDTEYILYYKQGVGETFYSKVVRTNPKGDDYGVYVGRAPLTKSDPGNLERDGYHYDAGSKTLTLKNYSITDMGIDVEFEKLLYANIRSQSLIYSKSDLTIELIGDNYLGKIQGESNFLLGNVIRAKGNITFKGDGNLTIQGMQSVDLVQSVEPGPGKDVYLKGTGKLTFENVGYAFYNMEGGTIHYINGELDINYCRMGALADSQTFESSGKKHGYTVYVTQNDAETASDFVLSSDDRSRILEKYNYNNDVLKYLHLVPAHNFTQQVQDAKYFVSGDCVNGTTFYKSCSCGAADHANTFTVAGGGHDLEHHDGKAATCIEDGWKAYDTCKKCDYTTFEVVPALGHDYKHYDEVAPTCEKDGCPAYDVCKVCGYSSLDKTIEATLNGENVKRDDIWIATGHALIYIPETGAVKCGKSGIKEHYECSTCGKYFLDEAGKLPISKNDLVFQAQHKLTSVPYKEATKDEDGNIAYYVCEDCGNWYSDGMGTQLIKDHSSVIIKYNAPKISKTKVSLKAGKTLTLKVTGGEVKSWKSSKAAVAKVSSKGKITTLKKGSATITATLKDGSKLTCKVTVTNNPTIKVGTKKYSAKTTYTVKKGKTLTVTITGKAPGVNNSYATTKKTIAKVISKKTVTKVKIKGLKKGTATVTIKVNGVAFKIKVKVK